MNYCNNCDQLYNKIYSLCNCNNYYLCDNCLKCVLNNINDFNINIYCPYCSNEINQYKVCNIFKYYKLLIYYSLTQVIIISIPIIYPIYNIFKNSNIEYNYITLAVSIYTALIIESFNLYFIKKTDINYNIYQIFKITICLVNLLFSLILKYNNMLYIFTVLFPSYYFTLILIVIISLFLSFKNQIKIIIDSNTKKKMNYTIFNNN